MQPEHASKKQIYVVLGMARSGTSAITRGLKALGVDLGSRLTPPCQWHPKGFWEDNDIVYQVNEKLLALLDSNWDSLRTYTSEEFDQPHCHAIKERAAIILNKRFTDTVAYGFKDPRSVRLLPFWQTVFAKMQLNDKYLIALRNPLSAAHSYQRLTGADFHHGLALWVIHSMNAIEYTLRKEVVVVSFETMIQNPREQLQRIQKALCMVAPLEKEINAYASEFLSKDLKHHDATLADLCSHEAARMMPLCIELYKFLHELANDQLLFNTKEFEVRWAELKAIMAQATPFYTYLDSVLQRKNKAEKYIHALHKSRLWRWIAPLRQVDNWMRHQKIKRRDQKKLTEAMRF